MAKLGPFNQGINLFKQGKYENALDKFSEVSPVLRRISISLWMICNKAIKLKPMDKQIYDSRAAVLEKLGRHVEALKDSKKVIDLAPQSWQVATHLLILPACTWSHCLHPGLCKISKAVLEGGETRGIHEDGGPGIRAGQTWWCPTPIGAGANKGRRYAKSKSEM